MTEIDTEDQAAVVRRLSVEIERLQAENAEQKAEMQKLYDNWVRVLTGAGPP